MSQLHSAHLGHRYAPMNPHDEHIFLGGAAGGGATAEIYGGIGDFGCSSVIPFIPVSSETDIRAPLANP